jgi:hypothetical protein
MNSFHSPAHDLVSARLAAAAEAINLDAITVLCQSLAPQIIEAKAAYKHASGVLFNYGKGPIRSGALTARRDAHQDLSVLVPAFRMATKLRDNLKRNRHFRCTSELAEFLGAKALMADYKYLRRPAPTKFPLDSRFRISAITLRQKLLAAKILDSSPTLFPHFSTVLGLKLPTEMDIIGEAQRQSKAVLHVARKALVEKILRKVELTEAEQELLQSFVTL